MNGRAEPLKAFELVNRAKPARRAELADDFVLAALVVGGRAESPRRGGLEFNAFDEAIEREVEVEPRLLAVGDDVETGHHLVGDGDGRGVFLELGEVGGA